MKNVRERNGPGFSQSILILASIENVHMKNCLQLFICLTALDRLSRGIVCVWQWVYVCGSLKHRIDSKTKTKTTTFLSSYKRVRNFALHFIDVGLSTQMKTGRESERIKKPHNKIYIYLKPIISRVNEDKTKTKKTQDTRTIKKKQQPYTSSNGAVSCAML